VQIALVDVPGHERFVRNHAGRRRWHRCRDVGVWPPYESIKPQTREHFDICRLIGIEHGIVALTKTDLVDLGRH
jgi:selenocysteine-specific elongation factor